MNPGAYSSAPMVNHMILSAIIIWNMGVVFHAKCGSDQSPPNEKDTRRLQKAYSLYVNSLSLVDQLVEHGSYGNAVVDLFAQSLLFNLWDCCKRLNLEALSEEVNGRLLRYSASIQRHYDDAPDALEILQTQTRQFVVNAILGRNQMLSGGVAAAA
mmetsp:Transcript_114223/g.170871  ORF Transcript_114223/g.170871 Transcript_114223/m.170871 type:complete len:156 (-) Transcript_114223:155-622(-)